MPRGPFELIEVFGALLLALFVGAFLVAVGLDGTGLRVRLEPTSTTAPALRGAIVGFHVVALTFSVLVVFVSVLLATGRTDRDRLADLANLAPFPLWGLGAVLLGLFTLTAFSVALEARASRTFRSE